MAEVNKNDEWAILNFSAQNLGEIINWMESLAFCVNQNVCVYRILRYVPSQCDIYPFQCWNQLIMIPVQDVIGTRFEIRCYSVNVTLTTTHNSPTNLDINTFRE